MRLQRLLGMLAVLLRQGRISAGKLAEQFEVSERTIYRDLETLEQAGVPIVTYPGVNGGIEIMDTYKLDKTVFLSDDFAAILAGLQSVAGTYNQAKLNQTLAKLRTLIPEREAEHVELSGRQIYVDLKPWSMHPMLETMLAAIQKGLEQSRLLTFEYTAREQAASRRVVEPHQLILKEQNWYLRGFCRERQDFRTFRLQRMREVALLEERFVPRPFSNDLDDFKEWVHPKAVYVEMIVPAYKRVALLEHCSPDTMTDLPDGTIHLRMPFVESDIGYGVMMEMGPDCEIIGPDFVRAEFIRRVTCFYEKYHT